MPRRRHRCSKNSSLCSCEAKAGVDSAWGAAGEEQGETPRMRGGEGRIRVQGASETRKMFLLICNFRSQLTVRDYGNVSAVERLQIG